MLRVASERLLLDRWEGLFSKSQECFEKSLRLGGIHASFTTESVTLRTERLITGAPPAGHYLKELKNTFWLRVCKNSSGQAGRDAFE